MHLTTGPDVTRIRWAADCGLEKHARNMGTRKDMRGFSLTTGRTVDEFCGQRLLTHKRKDVFDIYTPSPVECRVGPPPPPDELHLRFSGTHSIQVQFSRRSPPHILGVPWTFVDCQMQVCQFFGGMSRFGKKKFPFQPSQDPHGSFELIGPSLMITDPGRGQSPFVGSIFFSRFRKGSA